MHNPHHGPPDTSRGFEQSDLSIPGIVKGVVLYFIFTGAVGAVVLIGLYIMGVTKNAHPESLAAQRLPAPPNPLLQNNVTAKTDLWNLRARETYLLTTPSYVDKKHTTVRIPIDDAINKAAQDGPGSLSVAPAGAPNPLATPLTNTTSQDAVHATVPAAKPPNFATGRSLPPLRNPNRAPEQGRMVVPGGNSGH